MLAAHATIITLVWHWRRGRVSTISSSGMNCRYGRVIIPLWWCAICRYGRVIILGDHCGGVLFVSKSCLGLISIKDCISIMNHNSGS